MDFAAERQRMVDRQLLPRGIADKRVIAAFRKIERHRFVETGMADEAYADYPLPIGSGQTISQPYIVALMTELLRLKPGEKVLEIGTGSGYQAAILAELAGAVYSVERIAPISRMAGEILREMGYKNISISVGDGTLGWREHAPYDAIIVTAGAPAVPQSLVDQLAGGGRMVIPVGGSYTQAMTVVERQGKKVLSREVSGCVFVPLIGEEGWQR